MGWEKKWHGSNSQLKLFSSPKTESSGPLVSWLTQLCIYSCSFPHQKKVTYQWINYFNCHGKGAIWSGLSIKQSSDQLSSVKVYPSKCYILLFCFNNCICKKTQNKTKPIEMTTLDYKCIYNKIWIFPPVDCNHNFNYFVPHCFLYLSCTLLLDL